MNMIVQDDKSFRVTFPPLSGNLPRQPGQGAAGIEDFLLGSLQHPDVRLKRELRLKIRRSATSVSIIWDDAKISVEADSFTAAVGRFRLKVVDEFQSLSVAGNIPQYLAEAVYAGRA